VETGKTTYDRRWLLRNALTLATGISAASPRLSAGLSQALSSRTRTVPVALARCRTYADAEVRAALGACFDLLGGISPVVKGKTVTVKVNLTGQQFRPFMNRPVGETYMTHHSTVYHLAALVFAAGARRVRIVESTLRRAPLESTLIEAGWNLRAMGALGAVVYENTRNRGTFDSYAHLKVANGHMFASLDVNRAYADTDVMVSLAKLKQHDTVGVSLTMKNMFGITPSSLYGGTPGDEESTAGRGVIHDPRRFADPALPGLRTDFQSTEAGVRVPRATADICVARPVDLAIIDGVTSITGGESPYSAGPRMRAVNPAVLVAGTSPVSVDAVGMAIMGFDPLAGRGTGAFARARCENQLLLAAQQGSGPADLKRIELRGLTLEQARHPYEINALPGR